MLQLEERMYKLMEEGVSYGKTKYSNYLEAAKDEYRESKGHSMDAMMESSIAKTLKATESEMRRVFGSKQVNQYFSEDATTPGDIDSFINYGFDMVTAMLPASIIEDVASIQGTDSRIAEIFFMDIVKSKTKGSTQTAGDKYLAAQTGPNTGEHTSDEVVELEELYDGDGSTVAFSTAILAWRPIKTISTVLKYTIGGVSYSITEASLTFTDATIASSSLSLTTGVLNVTFTTAPDNGTKVYVTYEQDSARQDVNQNNEVIMKLSSLAVPTKRRFLNAKWMIDSAAMLVKEHGMDMEKELVEAMLAGVMNEISIEVVNDQRDSATANDADNGNAAYDFDKTPPSTTIPYVVHRQELVGMVSTMSTGIEDKVRKVAGNFVVGGKDFVNIIKGLPRDMFEPIKYVDKTPVGIHTIGMLDNQYKVIQNFDYDNTDFMVGAKGNSWMNTGYVYAPYIPLMTTPINWNQAGDHWRSLMTYYGKKVVNANFYAKGVISAS